MKNLRMVLLGVFFLLFLTFGAPLNLHSGFYEYRDKAGKLHFVDDMSKIPEEYRSTTKTHKEKYDDLPEEERNILLERESREIQIRREREKEEQKVLRRMEEAQEALRKMQEEQEAQRKKREEMEKRLTTNVIIRGSHVFVPVTLAYENNETEAILLLDTGATLVTLYKRIADRLGMDESETESGWLMSAGGRYMRGKFAKVDYVRVGHIEKRDVEIAIITYKGPETPIGGYLGMSFLQDFHYSIDYQKQVIKWRP